MERGRVGVDVLRCYAPRSRPESYATELDFVPHRKKLEERPEFKVVRDWVGFSPQTKETKQNKRDDGGLQESVRQRAASRSTQLQPLGCQLSAEAHRRQCYLKPQMASR